jgi:hypothetical protein
VKRAPLHARKGGAALFRRYKLDLRESGNVDGKGGTRRPEATHLEGPEEGKRHEFDWGRVFERFREPLGG